MKNKNLIIGVLLVIIFFMGFVIFRGGGTELLGAAVGKSQNVLKTNNAWNSKTNSFTGKYTKLENGVKLYYVYKKDLSALQSYLDVDRYDTQTGKLISGTGGRAYYACWNSAGNLTFFSWGTGPGNFWNGGWSQQDACFAWVQG